MKFKVIKPKFSSAFVAICIAFFYIFINFLIQLNFSEDISNAPDETGQNLFISQIADIGILPVNEAVSLNLQYKDVFAPRGTVVNKKGQIVPLKALFSSYAYGIPYTFFNSGFNITGYLSLVNSLTLFIFILYCYKYYESFGLKKNNFILLIILFLVFLGRFDQLITFYNLFIFISLYYLKIWLDSKTNFFDNKLFLSSLMMSIVPLLRNELIVLFIPLGMFFLYLIFIKKFNYSILFYFVLPIISIFTILLSNKIFYGNFFSFGYSLDSKSREAFKTNGASSGGIISLIKKVTDMLLLYGFHPLIVLKNTYYYVIYLFYFLLIPAIINFKELKKDIPYTILLLSIIVYILVFYGSNGTFFGNEIPSFGSSYVRYFSPIYLFVLVYALPAYSKLADSLLTHKRTLILLAAIYISISIGDIYDVNNAGYEANLGYLNLLDTMKQNIAPDAIIFSNYWDKLFYQNYQVATMSKQLDTPEDYYKVMERYYLDGTNRDVYFIPSDNADEKEFKNFLKNDKILQCKDLDIIMACKLERK